MIFSDIRVKSAIMTFAIAKRNMYIEQQYLTSFNHFFDTILSKNDWI